MMKFFAGSGCAAVTLTFGLNVKLAVLTAPSGVGAMLSVSATPPFSGSASCKPISTGGGPPAQAGSAPAARPDCMAPRRHAIDGLPIGSLGSPAAASAPIFENTALICWNAGMADLSQLLPYQMARLMTPKAK